MDDLAAQLYPTHAPAPLGPAAQMPAVQQNLNSRPETAQPQQTAPTPTQGQQSAADQGQPQAPQPAQDQPEGQQQPGDSQAQQAPQQHQQGDTSYLDPAHPDFATVAPVVQELGLSQPQVDRLVQLRDALTARQTAAWHGETLAAVQADPGLVTDARAAVAHFGGQDLKDALNASGLGNHPAVVKALAAAWRGSMRKGGLR